MKLYRYVGPKQIADRIRPEAAGTPIRSLDDIRAWVRDTSQDLSADSIIAMFVVDMDGFVRRRIECREAIHGESISDS